MEIHQLRYFEATARLGSMMAAAAECHVSQPALSVQIRKLEEEAGEALMVRRPRGIFLTPAGERTLMTARQVLGACGRWGNAMKAREFGEAPVLRVAAQHFISAEILTTPIAETLEHTRGRWALRFHERSAKRLEDELRSGASDLAVFDLNAVTPAGFAIEPLLRMPYRLFCPENHPLAGAGPVALDTLLDHQALLYRHAPDLEARLRRAAAVRKMNWEPAYSSEHASAVYELVAAGHGVAVLPANFEKQSRRRRTGSVLLADYVEEVAIAAAWARETEPPEPARFMFESIRKNHRAWAVE